MTQIGRFRRHIVVVAAGALIGLAAIFAAQSARPRRALAPSGAVSTAPGPRRAANDSETDEDLATLDPALRPAASALARGDFAFAFRLTASAQSKGAPKPDFLAMRAAIFKGAAYLDREIETLRQWSVAAPRDPRPLLKLFYIYLDLGWRREADQVSNRALALAPSNSRVQVARAIFYYRSSSPELAIKYVEEARRLDPQNSATDNLHESILLKLRRYADAEREVRKLPPQVQQTSRETMILIHALEGQNRATEAEALARQVQQREQDNLEAAYELGGLAKKRGDDREAERQFELVQAHDPAYDRVLWRLGQIYIRQGRKAEGQKLESDFEAMEKTTGDFETLQSRLWDRPDDAEIHQRLAKYHTDAGELPQSIAELKRVLQVRPHDADARRDLITCLQRQGRLTESRQLADGRADSRGYR